MGRITKPESLRSGFARRLRQVRAVYGASQGKPGLSQADFVRALGIHITAAAYRRYDNGRIEPPMKVLAAVRRLTGISLDYLICGLPAGVADLVTPSHEEITPGMRLRWTRRLLEPSIERIAHVMQVTPDQWQRYEDGTDPVPVRIGIETALRFGISLDFLYLGSLADSIEPKLLTALLAAHPELREVTDQAPDTQSASDVDQSGSASDASNHTPQHDGNMCR
jgi:transcriptional regulator with XRE-family HTH domain